MIHEFFGAIGFRELKRKEDLDPVLERVIREPDEHSVAENEDGECFAYLSKSFGGVFGVAVCGSLHEGREFRMEYYDPYLTGGDISTREEIEIERYSDRERYAGVCDELKIGQTVIFHISNTVDAMRAVSQLPQKPLKKGVALTGLSTGGRILLPVSKTSRQRVMTEKKAQRRANLMRQVREGNQSAIENLTICDMDAYTDVSRRLESEDILSIVESTFMPHGIEGDQYAVIGEITSCRLERNQITGERVWLMNLLCNGVKFDICINAEDLLGEPEIGRRFKGRIWMQGQLCFDPEHDM